MKSIARRSLIGTSAALLIAVAAWAVWAWRERAETTRSTDNAYVHGDITAISPKISGYVADVLVDDNQVVDAGSVLLRIADEDYRAQRDRAAATVAQVAAAIENLQRRQQMQRAIIREAEAAAEMARADVVFSGRQLARTTQLVDSGATSRRTHDSATADAERARAALARGEAAIAAAREQERVLESETRQLEARMAEARANLQLAEIALSETIIRAPVAGVVGNRRVRTGEYVRPGGVLLSIVPVKGVWVVANFKETQIARMHVGQAATITVDGYSGVAISGVVDSLSPGSGAAFSLLPPDNATGNFVRIVQRVPVKIRLDENHALLGRLVPGMSVEVSIDLRSIAANQPPQTAPDRLHLSLFRTARSQ
ncbi:HlyD family secretion protein [Bradyrhizobium sp. LHD-71]|uniref:HlyD family secretion protein n=1 Tax=Bradyrhizobium sp. LHD-71 TaxID=3072141 RepID=UPI00280CB117|nr:HlyD family secretion protein [Bradyrhizobium sp. LHD-71]MDQ8730629.1 HlyD family secretion protein [Bradyrhizobium sp. LHD-71]